MSSDCIAWTLRPTRLGLLLVAGSRRGVCHVCFGDDEEELARAMAAEFPYAVTRRDDVAVASHADALAAYVDGRIFLSLTPAGFALKLPPARRDELLAMGGRPLRYFAKAPVKKAYVLLSEETIGDDRVLAGLIAESVRFCLSGSDRS